jgi:methylenetetrahydrofolate dehydrogenase (NADP+)/methenyltetrahydrofolate cyclohydrolase
MSARLLDGRAVAASLKADLAQAAVELGTSGLAPRLATLRFDGDDAAAAYAGRLESLCGELGVGFEAAVEPGDVSTESAIAVVEQLNERREVSGTLVLLPPPEQVDTERLIEAIDPRKDVDGAHPRNAAALYLGTAGPAPATALAVLELLRSYEVPLAGRHVVVVGRSDVIGKPLALLLLRENATVTVCHSKTPELGQHTRDADVLVAATGRPGLITTAMVSPDTTVVDVGTNYVDGKLVGDVDPNVADHAAALSPVPGGVGPLTNLMLIRNLLELTQRYAGRE